MRLPDEPPVAVDVELELEPLLVELELEPLLVDVELELELEPLLAPFEASVYGRRRVTPAEFAAALAAASRFRAGQAEEAA